MRLYSTTLEQKVSTFTSQTLAMVNTNMVTELEKYQYLSGVVCTNPEIKSALLHDNMTDIEKNTAKLSIQSIIRTQIIYPAQAKNISVYSLDGKLFYNLGYDGFYQEDLDMLISEIIEKAPSDSWNYVRTYRSRDIIVLGRRIVDMDNTQNVLGYTLISIDEKLFSESVLSPIDLDEGHNIMYMNTDGTVLSSWDRSVELGKPYESSDLIREIQQRIPQKTDSFLLKLQEENQLVTYIYNKDLDQLFVSTIPLSYLNSEINSLWQEIGAAAFLLLALNLVIVFIIYLSISRPISNMTDFCRNFAEGNLGTRIQDADRDELSSLSTSMNHMADDIQQLLVTQKETEQQKREIELQMLQYQINPHFLFNTLNSLRFIASLNQDHVVSGGIQALSSLLHNSLTNTHEYITIGQEIENLKNYLSIQTIRYAGNFDVNYEIDEKLLGFLCPKLILQPLVENSIMHGNSENSSTMLITIRCSSEDDRIVFTLSDTGKGFAVKDKKLPPSRGTGLGLKNVNSRIQLHFGKQYGLRIKSIPGHGTVCTLTLPKINSSSNNESDKSKEASPVV